VSSTDLPTYVDLGLDLFKLGEEARVSLPDFTLEGSARKPLRYARSRMTREGCSFEIVPAAGVPPLLDDIQAISDAWLAEKRTREKRFSLGFFDRSYLVRTPLALVRHRGRIVAFANLWLGADREEVSVDLMRQLPDAPPGVMEYLFTELVLWSQAQGYRWYSLGIAPFSGFERHRLAPLWNKLGALLFQYGEHFYNFRGLRSFKEKFHPVWEPRYLAAPGNLTLPLVLTQVAALVSSGVAGVVSR
jgi:phosphatidylglycerol lysyltransferase